MIIETTLHRPPPRGTPLVLACFSFRHDAALVPGLLANIAPVVHGWVALDDRNAGHGYSSEPLRRRALLHKARQMGAAWLLVIDPDERLEPAWAQRIRAMITAPGAPIWAAPLLEMHDAKHARVDGLWGGKDRARLFPLTADIHVPDRALHGLAFDYDRPRRMRHCDLAIYHLRMATPGRRRHRREQYALLDPQRHMQRIGYDYLDMEDGLILRPVDPARMFQPPHIEDGDLWAAPLPPHAPVAIDPLPNRLSLIRRTIQVAGVHGARLYAARSRRDYPEDAEMLLLAARLAHECGDAAQAAALLAEGEARWPDLAAMPLLRAQAALELGHMAEAGAAAARAAALAPGALTAKTLADTRRGPAAFAAPDALWRRWVRGGAASIREGAGVARDAPASVVVIGFRGQPELVEAVDAIVAETPRPEVVVVNSGGGDLPALLGDRLALLRLIELEQPHFVGSARNIGIDASTAPVVAFLAGDCLPLPGWVAGRLAAHERGAAAVPSSIVTARPDSLAAWVASAVQHASRWPDGTDMAAPGYGLSYCRRVFDQAGYFMAGLAGGEDTHLNTPLHRRLGYGLHAPVCTAHRDPLTARALCRDLQGRARLRVQTARNWRDERDDDDLRQRLDREWFGSLQRPHEALRAQLGRAAEDATVYRLIALAARARRTGTMQGLALLDEAAALAARAGALAGTDPAAALPLAARACALDRFHAPHHLALARLHAALGDDEASVEAARTGLSCDATSLPLAEALCAGLVRLGRPGAALAEAEAAAMQAPASTDLWLLAADHAARGGGDGDGNGDGARAVLYAQMAFLASPDDPRPHRLLAAHAGGAGQVEAATRRMECAITFAGD